MNRLVLMLCLAGFAGVSAWGQEADNRKPARGYVFFAPGAATSTSCRSCTTGTLHFGGGGEALIYKGLGIGAEAGFVGPMEQLGEGVGLVSINGLYSFKTRQGSKVEPFLTAGYSLLIGGGGAAGGLNFGGGLHYWLKKRLGLRFEFRDHIPTASFSSHLFEGRVGLAF